MIKTNEINLFTRRWKTDISLKDEVNAWNTPKIMGILFFTRTSFDMHWFTSWQTKSFSGWSISIRFASSYLGGQEPNLDLKIILLSPAASDIL